MQRVVIQQATFTQIQTLASRELPGHETSVDEQAVNDDVYHDENSPIHMVFSVLANVVGGALLLSGMFFLPHVIGRLLS